MKKTLKYTVLRAGFMPDRGLAGYEVQITEQSHRNEQFGDQREIEPWSDFLVPYKRKTYRITSFLYPENALTQNGGVLYVRGLNSNKDNNIMFMTIEQFKVFEYMVKKYNNHEFLDMEKNDDGVVPEEPVKEYKHLFWMLVDKKTGLYMDKAGDATTDVDHGWFSMNREDARETMRDYPGQYRLVRIEATTQYKVMKGK